MRLFVIRFFTIFLLLFFSFPELGQSIETVQQPSALHAILMEENTGRVLYEKNAHDQRPIASITKVMTAVVALENGELHDKVKVSEQARNMSGSSIYLEEKEKISLEDLLYGLMLRSGNDAAVAIAEHIGGSVEGFVYLMNEKARYLGMTNTHFTNPHGLDEKNHYSSAYDVAILMRYAMKNEVYQKVSKTKTFKSNNRVYAWTNKNKLLTQLYPHSTGGKTGYTSGARRTLVTTAKKNSLPLIVVTLNASDDWNDHIQLFEWGFDQYELFKIESKGEKTFTLDASPIIGIIQEDIVYPLNKEEQNELQKQVVIYSHEDENFVGKVIYTLDGEKVIEIPIFHTKREKSNFLMELKQSFLKMIKVNSDG